MELSVFGFQALWSPYFFCVLLGVAIAYRYVTGKGRTRFAASEPLQLRQAMLFYSALLLLYMIKGSPLDVMAHISFTMHMVQMAFLLLLVPILFIKGIPSYMWEAFIRLPIIAPLVKILTQPLIALILFVTMFSVYHLPFVFDTIKLNAAMHSTYTLALFIISLCMYWPLLNNVEGQHEMKSLHKLGYIAGNAVLITPACALIIFASTPMYATYNDAESWMQAMALCVPGDLLAGLSLSGPELFTNMSPVSDQQVGGVLMKIIQEIIFGVILFKVFTKWWNNERANADEITANALKEFQSQK